MQAAISHCDLPAASLDRPCECSAGAMGRDYRTDLPATPGEILRSWQRGARDWLQVLSRTAQHLHSAGVHESVKVVQHLQRQHAHRHATTSAFASLSASLPASKPRQPGASRVRFSGRGMNCIISELAESAGPSSSAKGVAASDSSKPSSEEQERILISEVGLCAA